MKWDKLFSGVPPTKAHTWVLVAKLVSANRHLRFKLQPASDRVSSTERGALLVGHNVSRSSGFQLWH